jgi:iron complex transport system ATP-binding protein
MDLRRNQTHAADYADRICLMKDGEIYQNGTPAEILTAPNIKSVFDFNVSILERAGLPFVVPQTAT